MLNERPVSMGGLFIQHSTFHIQRSTFCVLRSTLKHRHPPLFTLKIPPSMPKTLWRETLSMRLFAFAKIPLLFFTRPAINELSDRACVVTLPLKRRNRNHLGSMYFAALAAVADTACGMLAMHHIRKSRANVSLIFKEFRAEFLKRAEGDTTFSCTAGDELAGRVRRAVASGERDHATVEVIATVPSKFGDEPVARFDMTISLKRRD